MLTTLMVFDRITRATHPPGVDRIEDVSPQSNLCLSALARASLESIEGVGLLLGMNEPSSKMLSATTLGAGGWATILSSLELHSFRPSGPPSNPVLVHSTERRPLP